MPDTPADSFGDLLRSLMGDTAYGDLTERLTDPVNYRTCRRDAIAWLADVIGAEAFVGEAVEIGVLRSAGMWDVPNDPGKHLAAIADRIDAGYTATELDALLHEEGLLREALDRTRPYYEDEHRPSCAPELYTVEVGERG